MPTFVPAVNCALFTCNGVQDGKTCQWSCGMRFPTAPTLTDYDALLTAMEDWVNDFLVQQMAVEASVSNIELRGLSDEDDIIKVITLNVSGVDTSGVLPAQVSVVVTKQTGLTGRSRRGRLYLFGIPAGDQVSERYFSSAYQVALNTDFVNFILAATGAGWTPVVISTTSGGVPRVTAQITDIAFMTVQDTRFDTQRRRLGRS